MPTHGPHHPPQTEPENTVRALGNVGVCITSARKKVLVDALHEPHQGVVYPYKGTAPALIAAMVQGTPPLDADVLLITHNHRDHVNPEQTAQFLHHRPKVPVCSCPQVAEALPGALAGALPGALPGGLRSHDAGITLLHPPLHTAQSCVLSGVPVTAVSLSHLGKNYAHVTNLGFIIALEKTFVHTGDAAPTLENLTALAEAGGKGAVVIAPFPYLTLPKAFALVQHILAPSHLFINHLPLPDGTENSPMGWLRSLRNALKQQQNSGLPITVMETENALYAAE